MLLVEKVEIYLSDISEISVNWRKEIKLNFYIEIIIVISNLIVVTYCVKSILKGTDVPTLTSSLEIASIKFYTVVFKAYGIDPYE